MIQTMDTISLGLLYSAMTVYAVAFVTFAVDLADRKAPTRVVSRQTVRARSSSAVATLTRDRPATVADPAERRSHSRTLRAAVSLTVLGGVLHLISTGLRGIAADRLPWANMYEFSLTGTLIIVGVFLVLLLRLELAYLGTFVTGLVVILLGISTVGFYVPIVPLQPALQSYWLVIHVLIALVSTALFAIAFALSVAQLARSRWDAKPESARKSSRLQFLSTLPDPLSLENLSYRLNMVGFILWTFTLVAGSIWAERAWGRYWGWDTKEVWTFIIWVVYAGYIHARATRGWRGSRSAVLSIIGFSCVMFNFGIVNVFFTGLHSYSGL